MKELNFLKNKYDLHKAPEVERAAKRTSVRTGEKPVQRVEDRMQNYLDRFKEIIDRPDEARRERGLEALKQILHNKFVIKPEEMPESYFTNQQRLARELGHGEVEINQQTRKELAEVIVTDQQGSLDNWIDYLSSKDATYPDWLKYYTFRSILNMGAYDKERHVFGTRSKGTTKPFPDINREALAYVLDAVEKKYKKDGGEINTDEEFTKLLQGENFAKLYAYAIEKVTPASKEALENVQGEWVKYAQGSDHMTLVKSLQGHGTGWCTAGESTAKSQLENGDFYVFYSLNESGQPKIPRAAIRMQGGSIAEVRGIAAEQNLDPQIGGVVREKLAEFSDGEIYSKKSADMKRLTEIDNKAKQTQELSKDDLVFIYEINSKIEGFGYQRDPRIAEIMATRNSKEDAPIVLDCAPEQVAWSEQEIDGNTKVYIGPLFKGVFQKNFEHIYTKFPEGKIQKYETSIGGRETKEELLAKLENFEVNGQKMYFSDYAKDMMKSADFAIAEKPKAVDLARLSVGDFNFAKNPTTDELYAKAKEFGLELCPAEVGPRLRLEFTNQANGDYFWIAMRQITDRVGYPSVFLLSRHGDGRLELGYNGARPDKQWLDNDKFVFRLRKLDS